MKPRRMLLGAGIIAGALYLQHLATESGFEDVEETGVVLGIWSLAALLAALLLSRLPRRTAAGIVLLGSFALLLSGVLEDTRYTWSSDQYRYRWDGIVQQSGESPYRYPPTAAQTENLRNEWLWPNPEGCAEISKEPGCTRLSYKNEPTIYPPVSQGYFLLVHLLPGPAEEERHRLWAGTISLLVVGALIASTIRSNLSPGLVAAYGLSPAHGLEAALDGHVDVLAVALSLGGLYALSRAQAGLGRLTPNQYQLLAGVLIGAAGAVKFYPLILLAGALSIREWRVWAAAGATFLLSYVPYLLQGSEYVLGYLPEYLQNEGYESGERFLLLSLVGIEGGWAVGVGAAALLGATVLTALRRSQLVDLVGIFFLVVNPWQTWYTLLLLALAIRARRLEWALVPAAGYPVYAMVISDNLLPLDGASTYLVALLGVIGAKLVRRYRSSRNGQNEELGDRIEAELPRQEEAVVR